MSIKFSFQYLIQAMFSLLSKITLFIFNFWKWINVWKTFTHLYLFIFLGLLPLMEVGWQQDRLIHSLLSSHPYLCPMRLRTLLPTQIRRGSNAPISGQRPSSLSFLLPYHHKHSPCALIQPWCFPTFHFNHSTPPLYC